VILPLNQRPTIVALCGSNGAGKTTFYHAYLQPAGFRLINADVLKAELGMDAYDAAKLAELLRRRLLADGQSFVFETVFSDPVGDKLAFLQEAVNAGYRVVVCFIRIASPETSDQRVSMRVSQGGHDVAPDKLLTRFPRTLANLKAAIHTLPSVLVFDNEDLSHPFQRVAVFENGKPIYLAKPSPRWLVRLITQKK
jgi:predicted ABC-type ATPase